MRILPHSEDETVPKPYPEEFRRDVVAVARKHEAPLSQIARELPTK